jgi:hypothetical protein
MHFDLLAQLQQNTDSIRQLLHTTGQEPTQDAITIWKLISYGGWGIMGPLFLMSLITVYILIDRLLALRRAMSDDRDFMHKLRDYMHSGKIDSARALCSSSHTSISRIIEKGLQRLDKPVKEIELAMESVGKQEVFRLEKGMGFLTLVAKLAPMFGFIGTIVGGDQDLLRYLPHGQHQHRSDLRRSVPEDGDLGRRPDRRHRRLHLLLCGEQHGEPRRGQDGDRQPRLHRSVARTRQVAMQLRRKRNELAEVSTESLNDIMFFLLLFF